MSKFFANVEKENGKYAVNTEIDGEENEIVLGIAQGILIMAENRAKGKDNDYKKRAVELLLMKITMCCEEIKNDMKPETESEEYTS